MSYLYNPYPTDQQSSAQAGYGHSGAQAQSNLQRTSHPHPGSSYRSALPRLSPNLPSLALPMPTFMAAQSRPAREEELKRSADFYSSRAREESLHLPRSYAMTPPSQGHRKAVAESSDGSLNWSPTYKSTNEGNASKSYTSPASSMFPGGGESRTSAASSIFSGGCESRFATIGERKPHEQFISGSGDYKFRVRETATADQYLSESASNIFPHFGLEKKDSEQHISYPEDQITPQNLPFILRQIRQQKTKNPVGTVKATLYPEPKPTTSVSDTDFRGHMGEMFHQDYRPRGILKTSKVIDYGHMSQFSAGPGEEVGSASGAHSVGNSTLLMDSSGREAKEMSISSLISSLDQESSVPVLDSPFSFKISSNSLPTKNTPREYLPPPKQVSQTASVPFTITKTDTDSRILPGMFKSFSLKGPEPSQLKSSKLHLSDTPTSSVASGRPGVVLYDSFKDPRQPLKQVSKVPKPNQQQQQQQQQPAAQRSPTPQVDTARNVPTPDQMYDYAAITPGMYPHSCSLCNKECFSVKEWINHQNTELHLENCKLLRTRFPEWDGELLTSLSASDVYTRSSTPRPPQSRKKSQNSSSCSHSESHSPRHYRSSGSRWDQEKSLYRSRSRSRSYSPHQSSRRTRRSRTRSRSQSPLYPSTTSRYRSRSRSSEGQSSPRRRDDRRSSTNRSRSQERHSSENSSAEKMTDGKRKTGLTMDEMKEEDLLKKITCVEMKSVFSPGFASKNRRVLHITNLPKYEDGSYTERDVANLLIPFGFQHEDEDLHNIYVIPQKRMAFAVLPMAEMAINVIRASVRDCFKLSGCKLFVKILEDNFSTPMEFYQRLMMWMNQKIALDQAERIIFIKNISQSEAGNLRKVLKNIGNVMNYVPLLNKVFVEFLWMHEADRLGVWHSFLRQPPQYFIYRLGTPRKKVTALRPDEPKKALPYRSLRVTDANVPTIPFVPLGCSPPFYVTMTTFPFIFPTICPWFNIPSYQDPSTVNIPSDYSIIMMTGLPEDGYCQLHVARMVWSLLHQRNIHSLFYRVMVLPLQRRAFIYFNDSQSCWEFSRRHIAKPFCVKNKPINIHFVDDDMIPGFIEETMYRQLIKLSNAHVPPLSGLDQRLLLVQVSEVSLELIRAVMKEVTSVGRVAGFLPLGNRICIEMLEPSDRMKVMQAKLGSLTAPHIWKKVTRVDTIQSWYKHQLHSSDVTINLKEHLPSSTKPATTNTAPDSSSAPKTSKVVKVVEQGTSGAVHVDSEMSSSTECKSHPDQKESLGLENKERSPNTESSSEQEKSSSNSLAALSAVGLMVSAQKTAAQPADKKGSTCSGKMAEQKNKEAADKAEKPAEPSIKSTLVKVLVKQDPQEEEEEEEEVEEEEEEEEETLSNEEAADRKLTMGEMMEENLQLTRITFVEMKKVFSPEFTSQNRCVLQITNLPKYEDGSYTERDVVNLLTPFGFQHEDRYVFNIYVIPQKCMAFAVLPTTEMAVNIIRASMKDCFKLSGCKLIMKILENKISTPLVFYKSLMMWMNEKMKSYYEKNIVLIKNISPSEARNLRGVLKKVGTMVNYVPLLNKVFIHFLRIHEVDRFGIWYSLLRQPPKHSVYRLITPRGKRNARRPRGPKRALPALSLRVADARRPSISSIPQGCSPPFYVTMTTFPFMFPIACPWFNIPSFLGPSKVKVLSNYTTIMMTGLPEDGYCQLDVARMVWSLLHQRNIHSLFYRVMVLPLQRRAFIYFNDSKSCWEFSRCHVAKPFCIKNQPVNIHFVRNNMKPEFIEETMYRQVRKLSNAHVPPLGGLDQRLLVVQVSEVSLTLIQAVMKEVTSVGRVAGFLPLGNRICIEMLEPRDRTKVMEAKLGSLTAPHLWKKVIRVDTVQSLDHHQLQSLDVTIDLEEDLYWVDLDHNAQDYNSSPSSSTKPAAANIAPNSGSATETSKDVEMVEEGSSGAAKADSEVANSDNMTRTKKLPEGHTPSKKRPVVLTVSKHCHVLPTPSMEHPEGPKPSEKCPEGQKLSKESPERPTPSEECPEGVKASVEHPEDLSAGLNPSKEHRKGQTPSEKCLLTPSEEHLEGPKLTEDCSKGLAPSEELSEGLTSFKKHLEDPTQSKVHLECMIPSEKRPEGAAPFKKCPESAAPSEEQSKGLTQSKELPQGLTPFEERPQSLTPSEELPQGPIPTEELPQGPTLSVEKSEGSTQSEECPEGSMEKSSCTELNSQPHKEESSCTKSKERSLNTESRYEQEKSSNRSIAAFMSAENAAAKPEEETPVKVPKEEEISVTPSPKSEEKKKEEMENYQNLVLFEEDREEDKEDQLPGSEEDQSLDGLSFQVLDSIYIESMADQEESGEPQPKTSFQVRHSVTEEQSATNHMTETKVSNIAKRPRRGRGGKRGRKPNLLAAKKDITDQENFEVIVSVKNPTKTEDLEPTSSAPKDVTPEAELEPIREEEVCQVIDSVDEQTAANAKKKPTRRSERGRPSDGKSEEKQDENQTKSEATKPDSITNKGGVTEVSCSVLDSAGSDTIQETQKVGRRRSTRGNEEEKIPSQTAGSKEEPKYQVIDSVEDDVVPEKAVTRATRGRRGRPAKRDIPTQGQTAAKECEEGKEMSPKAEQTAVTVEEAAYKVIDSVEDKGAPDTPPISGQKKKRGRPRNVKAASKHAISKKAKDEIEEEPTYQIIDLVEEATENQEISDDPGTAEESSTPEDDYDKQKITQSVCDDDKEKPMYQIADSVEDDQGQEETEVYPLPDNMIPGAIESSTEGAVEHKDYTNLTEDKNRESSTWGSAHVILVKEAKELEKNNEEPGSLSSSIEECRSKEIVITAFEAQELLTLDNVSADKVPEEHEEDSSEGKEGEMDQDLGPDATTSGRKVGKGDRDEGTQTKESQSEDPNYFSSKQKISTAEAEASGQSDKGATASLEEGRCEVKVVGKRRKELVGPEAKRCRSQSPDVPADFTLLMYSPGNPLGQEFVVPKVGFVCHICSIFYINENTAKEDHCSSRIHFDNLKKYYLKLKKTPSRASSPS